MQDQHYLEQVNQASDYLKSRLNQAGLADVTRIGIILGTGLGRLANEMETDLAIDYHEIPHFPLSTVESHQGKLLVGTLGGVPMLAMQGRFHLYEGYSAQEITLPVRVFKNLGIQTLIVSNAAGGMNPLFKRGDLMLITDHINLLGVNPLVGPNVNEWGARFPDMSDPYNHDLRQLARQAALEQGIPLQQGVYVAVTGPNLETKAEYRFLRRIGADAVGMSTVPEVIVASHAKMQVLAFSVITDECFPEALQPISIPEILAAAAEAEPKMTRIIQSVVQKLGA
jgi:purine-nucleoside phosphorylase